MDLTILTTFFCLILLVLSVLALNELMILKRKVNAHLDRSDLHSDKLATILSILQQLEAKQDLLFNNAPPATGKAYWSEMPGIDSDPDKQFPGFMVPKDTSKEDAPEGHTWHYPLLPISPASNELDISELITKSVDHEIAKQLAQKALKKHKAKVSSTMPEKKRGRPKKASKD